MPELVRHESNNRSFALFHVELNLADMQLDTDSAIDNARHEIISNGYSIMEMLVQDAVEEFKRVVYFYCKQLN